MNYGYCLNIDGAVVMQDATICGADDLAVTAFRLPQLNPDYKFALYDIKNNILLASKDAKQWVIAIAVNDCSRSQTFIPSDLKKMFIEIPELVADEDRGEANT